MSDKDVSEAKASMTKAEFEQEYLASFTVFAGQIFEFDTSKFVTEFDRNTHSKVEVIGGLDPGYRDPTAFVVIAYIAEEDVFHVVDEYQASEVTTSQHAEAITNLNALWGIETIFIDSAAAQFAGDLAYTYNIATIKAKKQVLEGIAYLQTIISQGRLRVSPHCSNTLLMLDQYQWDTSNTLQRERPVHDHTSHIADALRYALYSYTI
jgi:phage terminase large subunit